MKAQMNVDDIKHLMSSWNATPLFERSDAKGETLLCFDDREEKVSRRYTDIKSAGSKIDILLKVCVRNLSSPSSITMNSIFRSVLIFEGKFESI